MTGPVTAQAPSVAALRQAAATFARFTGADAAGLAFAKDTAPAADLSRPEHRGLLLRFLNSWGCRIRYPREGEPDLFDAGLDEWWGRWSEALPPDRTELSELSDEAIARAAEAFGALAAVEVTAGRPRRTLGPTAAAKALHALRPRAVMPWDAAIAQALHGARDADAFAAHLRLGRAWARAVVAESGLSAADLPAELGRPAVTLAKVVDEYFYVTITMEG